MDPGDDYRQLSAKAGKTRRITWWKYALFTLLILLIIALVLTSVGLAIYLMVTNYGSNITDYKRSLEVIVHFGDSWKEVFWQPETAFTNYVYVYTADGTTLLAEQLTSVKLWLLNATSSAGGVPIYYSVNTVMDGLVSDILAAIDTVNPVELAAFLSSMFSRRSVSYTNEFVSYLSLVEANITALQNATHQILDSNSCRGKPLESTVLTPFGDQTLLVGQSQGAVWGNIRVLPSSASSIDFTFAGQTVQTLLDGVYAITANVNLATSANATGTTSLILQENGVPAFQTLCQVDQPSPSVAGSAQCQGTAVLSLTRGANITLVLNATQSQVTYTSSNSRLMLSRVC